MKDAPISDATATGSRRAAHLRTALGVGAVIAIAAGISRLVGAADAGGPVLVQLLAAVHGRRRPHPTVRNRAC